MFILKSPCNPRRRHLPGLSLLAALGVAATPVYRGPTTAATYRPLSLNESETAPIRVAAIADGVRREFEIPSFYTRGIVVRDMPIIGSDKVSDFAFLECGYVLDHMLADSPARVLAALTRAKVRIGIISVVEYTMDLPENQTEENRPLKAAAFQDRRSRGLGGIPMASCGEENLLNLPSDPYRAENINIHEFAHTIAYAMQVEDPAWYAELTAAYKSAMAAGRFAHSYSARNGQEYWAEGAQAWFDCADPRQDPAVHSGIWTREQLKAYDPDLARLLAGVYGDGAWRYVRSDGRPLVADGRTIQRSDGELSHLAGLERGAMPAFDIRNSPRVRALAATRPATHDVNRLDDD